MTKIIVDGIAFTLVWGTVMKNFSYLSYSLYPSYTSYPWYPSHLSSPSHFLFLLYPSQSVYQHASYTNLHPEIWLIPHHLTSFNNLNSIQSLYCRLGLLIIKSLKIPSTMSPNLLYPLSQWLSWLYTSYLGNLIAFGTTFQFICYKKFSLTLYINIKVPKR